MSEKTMSGRRRERSRRRGHEHRGQGRDRRGDGDRDEGLGPEGQCICPKCGRRSRHEPGLPCQEDRCPECGTRLLREGSEHHALWLRKHGEDPAARA
jgi:hypothetical protein